MSLRLADSHCHLDFERYDEDRREVLLRARAAGVDTLVQVICSADPIRREEALAWVESVQRARDPLLPELRAIAGLHPHEAALFEESDLEQIEEWARAGRVAAIGEVGLDYHYDHSPRDTQRVVFRRFLALACELRLPVVIHTRSADKDCLRILRELGAPEAGGVIHCYTGGKKLARYAREEAGLALGFTGILTFPGASDVRDRLQETPLESLLLETDAPYLAPVPHRGKRNEPSYVRHTAEAAARLLGRDLEELAKITRSNCRRLFGFAGAPARPEPEAGS